MTDPTRRGNPFTAFQIRHFVSLLCPAILFVLVAASTWPLTSKCHPDLGVYYRAADLIAQGELPYRDFRVEYPPFALVACLAPLAFGWGERSPEAFRWGFLFANAAYLTVIAWAVRSACEHGEFKKPISLWSLTLSAGILACFLAWRYDLFPAMLTALAFLAAIQNRPIVAGGLLGLGISAKLYPVVLLPVFAFWFFKRSGAKVSLLVGLAAFGSLGITVLPFLPGGISGLIRTLTYHSQRSIHIESLSGGLILLTNLMAGERTPIGVSYGAWHIHSPAASSLASLHFFFFVFLYAVFFLIVLKSAPFNRAVAPPIREFALVSLGALLAFVVGNKVLSPQYFAWLFPFIPFLKFRPLLIFVLVCTTSILVFPVDYDSLLRQRTGAVTLLNFRNAALLLLFITTILEFYKHRPTKAPQDPKIQPSL